MNAAQLHLGRARSFLFVPATRPERIAKAVASGTDVVIVDLEDAVGPADKPAARSALLAWLDDNPGQPVVVRINAAGTEWHEVDLAACRHPGVAGVMLPKAETAAAMAHAHAASTRPLLPIVETAAGLAALPRIATALGCCRLVFGKLDLAVELDLMPDEADAEELVFLPYRAQLVIASRLADLPPPVDGVFTAIGAAEALAAYARRARRHGFGGQLLIHPSQVEAVTAAFTPAAAEVDWARAVLAATDAAGGWVVVVEGRMVDAPVIARARRVLAAAALAAD